MNIKTKKISILAMLASIAAILMILDFKIPIAPYFMKVDISELPVVIGGFILGPVSCVFVAILKIVIKLIIKPSSTLYVGELANLVGCIFYSLPACIIYKKIKTKKIAIIGLIIGTVVSSIVLTLCNYYFIFPIYINVFNFGEEKIIALCSAIFPIIDSMQKVMLFSVLPFNLVKYLLVSILTYIFYKKISRIIKSILEQ